MLQACLTWSGRERETQNLAQRPRGGRSDIFVKWGGLEIELDDFTYAGEREEVEWVRRFLIRFPGLRRGIDKIGSSFRSLENA